MHNCDMAYHFGFPITNKCGCHLVQIQLMYVYTPLQSSLKFVLHERMKNVTRTRLIKKEISYKRQSWPQVDHNSKNLNSSSSLFVISIAQSDSQVTKSDREIFGLCLFSEVTTTMNPRIWARDHLQRPKRW